MANSCCFLVSQSLLPDYQRLLSSTPSRRLNPLKLIDNSGEFLSQRTISGSLLKYLSKLQVNCALKFIHNIKQKYFCFMQTRKRVLINAFTVRALRDTFSPARIMALSATISYYDMTEISTRILPNIVVLTSDPDG
ncbi:hypothetical protein B296_00033453 [Ensete ventricosum]|uniref:Uncharacterized protein n=1 Tax=Ensete ventricosum TaxID=4639 RepID=A0A427AAU1_ENSVE|nr:hypothetical protein B296_00033453 [Ensete ventricosum]